MFKTEKKPGGVMLKIFLMDKCTLSIKPSRKEKV